MKRTKCIGLLAIFMATSCSQNKKAQFNWDTISSSIENESIFTNDFLSVGGIFLTDSVVWIYSEQNPSHLLYAYNLDGQRIAQGIGKGTGNNEVLEISSLHKSDDKSIDIYDSRCGKIYNAFFTENGIQLATKCDGLRMCDEAVRISDLYTLILPINSHISYAVIDTNNIVKDSLSYFPPKPEGIDTKIHQMASTGDLAYSPEDKKFMRAVAYDGGLTFGKIEDCTPLFDNRFAMFDMEYGFINAGVDVPVPCDNSRVGYSNVYATPRYFYATFSEETVENNPDGLAKEIHIFDHDGSPIERICFNNEIGSFAVSEDDSYIYAISVEDDNTPIRRFALNRR